MHTPVYLPDGRLERTIVTRESEWDDGQVALLIASKQLRTDVGSHGHPMSEAMSPLADPNRVEGWHYVAHVHRDWAAKEIADKQAKRAKDFPDADLSADIWTVEKVWND